MAGLPWIKVAVDLPRHPKSTLLAARLDDPRAWSYVVQLWAWVAENYAHGEVSGESASVLVARGAGWTGDADTFCRHLVAVGFIDTSGEGLRVHDWTEWAGAHVEKKAKDAIRKAKSRAKPTDTPSDIQSLSSGCPRDVRATYPGRPPDDRAESATQRVKSREDASLSPRELGAADGAALRGGLPTQDELRASRHPRLAQLVTSIRAAGEPAEWPRANAQCIEAEKALGDQSIASVVPRVLAAIKETCRVGLGWHVDAIRGGPRPRAPEARPRSRGMATPDTDWTSEAATKL